MALYPWFLLVSSTSRSVFSFLVSSYSVAFPALDIFSRIRSLYLLSLFMECSYKDEIILCSNEILVCFSILVSRFHEIGGFLHLVSLHLLMISVLYF